MNFEQMKSAIEHPALSLAIIGRFMPILRPAMKKAGIDAFPVIALTGKPGSGKTSILEAIVGTNVECTFQHNWTEVKHYLQEHRNTLAFVDDYARQSSGNVKESQASILERIVRHSYNGQAGQLAITVEKSVLPLITESCSQRILFVDIGDGVADPNISSLLYYLAESQDLFLLENGFRQFVKESSIEYSESLKLFRTAMTSSGHSDPRTATLIFTVVKTASVLNEFFFHEGFVGIDQDLILQIIKASIADRTAHAAIIEEIILERLLASEELMIQSCDVIDECSVFCNSGCKHRNADCITYCQAYPIQPSRKPSYTPYDFFLDWGSGFNALLIENPQMVPFFQRPYPFPSILIIEAEDFTRRMNSHLANYCLEVSKRIPFFTHEKLRKALLSLNRCLVIPNENKGYRYTFQHPVLCSDGVTEMRAVGILLRPKEVERLKLNIPRGNISWYRRQAYAAESGKVIYLLRKLWPLFTINATPIGEYYPED